MRWASFTRSPITRRQPVSLSRQLLQQVLLLGLLLAVSATALNAWLSWLRESARQEQQLQSLIASQGPGLAKAVWDFDEAALQLQLAGLAQFPVVLSAQVRGPQIHQRYLKPGALPAADGPARSVPLLAPNGREVIATWTLQLDPQAILQQVWRATRGFVWLVALELLLQALLVYGLIRRAVSRPLQALSRHVGQLSVLGLARPAPVPLNGPRNELHELAAGITRLQLDLNEQLAHRDATARELQRQRDALDALSARQTRQLDEVLQRMADGAGVLDARGHVILANPAWAAWVGLAEPSALVGLGPGQWLSTPPWSTLLSRLQAEQALSACALSLRRHDGEPWPVDASFSVIERDAQGQAQRVQMVLHDVSARLETERSLIAAREAALAATHAKSEFLANMSHEIRTPMNAVLGFTELALFTELSEQQRDYLDKSRGAALSLLDLLNQILDFSKIEAGKLQLVPMAFELMPLLDDVLACTTGPALAKGLRCELEVPPEVPRQLVGDAMRLRQVLVNLCSNAVKFTAQGLVCLRLRVLPAAAGYVHVGFEVQDTGIGMAAAELSSLFQPFTQADASITRHYGGTGLGLAISQQLVQLMGGRIAVRSSPGQGSVFGFELPFGVPPAEGLESARPGGRQALSMPDGLADLQVLLVEDNEVNQQVAQELLASAGVQVTVARNGLEALDWAARSHFDAVLMDVQMPEMDGFEATRRLRTQPRLAQLPIIAMTAHALASERAQCLASGMDDFLSKPFEPAALYAILARWARRPER